MPTNYYGDGSIPAPVVAGLSQVLIASSTNATPIVVQTTTAHGFTNTAAGDTVEIEGHLVNTNANGVWQISVVDTTHFSLDGSVGNGVGGATGYAIDYSINPAQSLPSDGDLDEATILNPPAENLTNMVPFLYRRAGRFRLYDVYSVAPNGSGSWATGTPAGATYVSLTGGDNLLGFSGGARSPVAQPGDLLVATLTSTLQSPSAASPPQLGLGLAVAFAGGAFADDPGSQQAFFPSGISAISTTGFSLSGYFPHSALSPSETFDFAVRGARLISGSANNIAINIPYRLTVHHYRRN